MTDRTRKLSLTRQAALLGVTRGSLYYAPRLVSEAELKLMRRIDELHMDYPFAGSRMVKGLSRQDGFSTGRLSVATLMKQVGIEALYRRRNTSKPAPGHKIYPYASLSAARKGLGRFSPVQGLMPGQIRPG